MKFICGQGIIRTFVDIRNSYPVAFTDKFDPEDYYMTPEGYIVFTEKYHLKRGYCCQSGCRHCPYRKDEKSINKKSGSKQQQ